MGTQKNNINTNKNGKIKKMHNRLSQYKNGKTKKPPYENNHSANSYYRLSIISHNRSS
jgi:hypothetical protein